MKNKKYKVGSLCRVSYSDKIFIILNNFKSFDKEHISVLSSDGRLYYWNVMVLEGDKILVW